MLRGELVELRVVERENLEIFRAWMNDPEVTVTLGVGVRPLSAEDERRWYTSAVPRSDSHYSFQIHVLGSGQLVGSTALMNVDAKNRNAEIGIVIGEKDCWGMGYGTDTVRVLCRYGFEQLDLHRIYLETLAVNDRGQRAYVRAGFVEEGRRRDAWYRDGRHVDSIVMSMLRHEKGTPDEGV